MFLSVSFLDPSFRLEKSAQSNRSHSKLKQADFSFCIRLKNFPKNTETENSDTLNTSLFLKDNSNFLLKLFYSHINFSSYVIFLHRLEDFLSFSSLKFYKKLQVGNKAGSLVDGFCRDGVCT